MIDVSVPGLIRQSFSGHAKKIIVIL